MAKRFTFSIIAQFQDQVRQKLGTLQGSLEGFARSTEGAARYARRGLLGLVGGITAVGYAAAEQDKADRALADALKTTGQWSQQTEQHMKDFAASLQDVTIYGDEQIEMLVAQALNLGISADKMEETIQGAIGLSKALDIDLNTALRYGALAMQGEYTVLQRYVPALRDAETEAEKLAIVQGLMAQGFAQAKGEAETLSGDMKQLKNDMGDLAEAAGAVVLSTVGTSSALEALRERVKGLSKWLNALSADEAAQIRSTIKWGAGLLAIVAILPRLAATLAVIVGAVKALLTAGGAIGAMIVVSVAGLAIATDALLGFKLGIVDLLSKSEALDSFWTSLAAGIAKTAGALKHPVKLAGAAADVMFDPSGVARHGMPGLPTDEDTQATVDTLWGDFDRRHPGKGKGGAGVAGGLPDAVRQQTAQLESYGRAVSDKMEETMQELAEQKRRTEAIEARIHRLAVARY